MTWRASIIWPYVTGAATLPPAVLAAAVEGCLRRELWEPVEALVSGGYVPSSAAAPQLVAALIASERLVELERFLALAREVGAYTRPLFSST